MGFFFCPTCHISCAALHFILRCNICFYRFIIPIHPRTFQAFLPPLWVKPPVLLHTSTRVFKLSVTAQFNYRIKQQLVKKPLTLQPKTQPLPFRSKLPLTIHPTQRSSLAGLTDNGNQSVNTSKQPHGKKNKFDESPEVNLCSVFLHDGNKMSCHRPMSA